MKNIYRLLRALLVALVLSACGAPSALPLQQASTSHANSTAAPGGSSNLAVARQKIKHVIIIMQENRSFDHYFGTFPGADGIPMNAEGIPTVCINDPDLGKCVTPFYNPNDIDGGGPHHQASAVQDIDGGKMDGFIISLMAGRKSVCKSPTTPGCSSGSQGPDIMGYHDAREIPNYWTYAEKFVLQDHMFEPDASWSLPAHLFMVSGWAARCSKQGDPMSCVNALDSPGRSFFGAPTGIKTDYAWTDLTYLLYKNNVSWAYYLTEGTEPDCPNGEMICDTNLQKVDVPSLWNPLADFTTVHLDNQLGNIQTDDSYFEAAKNGQLPAVSWIVPEGKNSEHPPDSIRAGQAYVTGIINAAMQGPDWDTTAIFLAWDDWGGFYDHVVPPVVDQNGYGLRVPGLMISAYARKGYIDHQMLSFDAYLKFIEDIFLSGQRIDPATDGRPDPRPTVRENVAQLGDLLQEFDFAQAARRPLVLPENPPPGPASLP
jgi:phospholipase C